MLDLPLMKNSNLNNINRNAINQDAYDACTMAENGYNVTINQLNIRIQELKDTIKLLQEENFFLKHKIYSPTTELVTSEQLLLDIFPNLKVEFPLKKEDISKEVEIPAHTRKARLPKQQSIPDFLERKDIIVDLPESEKFCEYDQYPLTHCETKIHEKLVAIPAQYYVNRYITHCYKCSFCEENKSGVNKDIGVLPLTIGSPNLFSQIIVSKFCDGIPIYRFQTILKRQSIFISRQTIYRWINDLSDLVMPIINLMRDYLIESGYILMDETPFQVNKEENKKASSKSYMWVQCCTVRDNKIILYDYNPSRSGNVPIDLLQDFSGYLQVDGYSGYSPIVSNSNGGIIRVGCWDHCRRKFVEANKISEGKGISNEFLYLIKVLYENEQEVKNLDLDEKLLQRSQKSSPVLNKLYELAIITQTKNYFNNNKIKEAVQYMLNEWHHLNEYIKNAKLNISNIIAENAIRPFAIGRRAWLFSDGPDGANSMATFYSLAITATKNGINPNKYFSTLFTSLPLCNSLVDYEKLLPFKENFLDNSS